jgi:DNA-binding response OmpR family regulator
MTMGRVLVVEENRDLGDSLAALCECWGHDVANAREGHEALALVAAFSPDVVIVHLGLTAEVDGREVMRRIRATDGWRVFILALTGWTRPQDRANALSAGANVCVLKPPDIDVLERTLERATEKTRDRR